ncbi:hypothetical protein D9M71_639010 [compost metagenome]
MKLNVINMLSKTFGERYVSAENLFRKSLNTVAAPVMGSTKAVLWIIVDNGQRGEDVTRRHYETMLAEDSLIAGKQLPIDPYGGPRELAIRLLQQGYEMKLTLIPAGFAETERYLTLQYSAMMAEFKDIQAVCYNLDNRVMPEADPEPLKIEGINS